MTASTFAFQAIRLPAEDDGQEQADPGEENACANKGNQGQRNTPGEHDWVAVAHGIPQLSERKFVGVETERRVVCKPKCGVH